ncbi:hypothetical protein ACFLSQ_08565 [Bacteroidota bacterium]
MKIFLLIIFTLLFIACNEIHQPDNGDNPCPIPEIGWEGWANIPSPHHEQTVSYDLKHLAYVLGTGYYLKVLDLISCEVQVIDIQSKLPGNVLLIGCGDPTWCPYDNNRLLIHAATSTDTNNDGKNYVYGQNLYIVSLDGSEFKKVTPSIFGKAGGSFGMPKWLVGSNYNIDSLLFIGRWQIYIPQTDSFVDSRLRNVFSLSHDQKKIITWESVGSPPAGYYLLNGKPLLFPEQFSDIQRFSFSPNGRLIAASVSPYQPEINLNPEDERNRFQEIWIGNADDFLDGLDGKRMDVKIINPRSEYCMYSLGGGLCAEFITDTTLAVSMHKDGDDISYLWEITTVQLKKN